VVRPRTPSPRLGLALAAAGLTALALPAAAADPAPGCYVRVVDGPQYCTQQVWFAPSDSKVGNLAAVGAARYPTWTTSAPTQSVTQGAGGGYATNGVQRQQAMESNPQTGALFKGSFTGDIDNLAVTMFLFAPGRQQEESYYAGIDVVVDGKKVFTTNEEFLPLSAGGAAAKKLDFAVSGLPKALARAGVASGPGVKHDVELFLTAYPLATTTGAFVYGTTEAPSSMTFNLQSLGDRVVLRAS
jgi:hypothetical protein